MRIVFMGGKRVGCACLEYLLGTEHEVVGVVVNPQDKAANRWYPSAAELALRHGVAVFQWASVNSAGAVEAIERLAPDVIVVVYFDQILKRRLFNIPPRGCINLHLALAEEYRGCYPTTWAILNDEKRTGITLHLIDESIDGGPIIAQREIPIDDSDTGRSLYEKCTDAGIQLLRDTFPSFAHGTVSPRPQNNAKARYHKREFPTRTIDFRKPGRQIYNQIRAMLFEPFPPPCFYIGDQKYEITKAASPD